MESYEKAYYGYQTKARGLLTADSLKHQFNRLAKWYGARLSSYLPVSSEARCLDLPCGYGNFLFFLKSRGYTNISGIDLDKEQVKLAGLLGLPAINGDAFLHLEGQQETYDLLSSLDFIEHLNKNEAIRFLKLCHRTLKPGGVMIVRAPCGDGPFGAHDAWNDLTHQWGMTSNVLKTLLAMQGFTNIEILDERPQPTSLIGFLRWLIFFPAKACASAMCMALGMRPPAVWTRSMIAVGFKSDASGSSGVN